MLSITRIDPPPSRRDLLASLTTAGAALLEGWSDTESWRIFLPWPEEVRELPWDRAAEWKAFFKGLTDAGSYDRHAPMCHPERSEGSPSTGGGGLVSLDMTSEDGLQNCPFLGGWVGFIAYETTALSESAPMPRTAPPEPAAFFARHHAGVVVTPGGNAFLFAPSTEAGRYRAALTRVSPEATRLPTGARAVVRDSLAAGAFATSVCAIREAIRDGDVYQVNLTRSFEVDAVVSPARLYTALVGDDPPRASAFIRGSGWSIVSASPEVLLSFDARSGIAESRPIKGTVRRDGDDTGEIAALLASAKDAAEHLMIVDLVRNDLGKVAPPGRVSVSAYRTVQTLEHVVHLESTVRAEGLGNRSVSDVLEALSPAGSITGAPKRAAVAKIAALEPVARGVYTGSIGYLDARGTSEFSVAIRTAIVTSESVRYHAGGGIVWDSDAAAEDAETRAKSVAFLRFFGEECA